MDRKKKIVLGIAAAAGIIYFATRKKNNSTTTAKDASGNSKSFQLANLTDIVWTKGVGILPFSETRGWGSDNLLLINKTEKIANRIGTGTKLRLSDGKILTVSYVDSTNYENDPYDRIALTENVSGLTSIAGFPAKITIV